MAKNIEINYNSGSGYEVLYPKTIPELTGCLPLSGGTLTGPLMLSGEPSGEMEAVNKGYVDGQIGGVMKKVYEGILAPTGSLFNRINFWENVASARSLFFAINGVQGTGAGTSNQNLTVKDESEQEIVDLWLGSNKIEANYQSFSVIFINNGGGFSPSKSAARGDGAVYCGAPSANLNTFFSYYIYYASMNLIVWAIF